MRIRRGTTVDGAHAPSWPVRNRVMRPRRTATVRRALGISTVALLLTVSCAVPAVIAQEIQGGAHWVGTWASAAFARPQPPPTDESPLGLNNQTLRQVVHTSIGGDHVRVVLSNVFGTAPLEVGAAHIALRASEAGIVPTLGASLTFNGNRGIRIPAGAGAEAVTDPVPHSGSTARRSRDRRLPARR